MWSVIMVLLFAVAIFFLEFPSLRKKRYVRDSILFIGLLVIGTVGNIMLVYNITLPNPLELMSDLCRPFVDGFFQMLQ